MGEKTRRKLLSVTLSVSLIVNSLLPYGVVGSIYAQESTVQESPTPLSSETPFPFPIPPPTTIPSPTVTPDSTNSPSPDPILDSSPTAIPSASPEASPSATPSATPSAEPTSTPSADPNTFLQEKTPLRREGSFLKERKEKQEKGYVEGEVIVKFRRDKLDVQRTFGKAQAYVFEKKFALEKKDEIENLNIRVFKSKKSTEEMVRELGSDPNVEYVQPNYIYEPATINTNDPYKDLLWGLDNPSDTDIDAPEAWTLSEGSGDVTVAVIDSGVAYNHPDLVNNMWDGTSCKDENGNALGGCNSGYDFEDGDKFPLPTYSSHGTHIAGTIAAAKDNGIGIIGVAPNVKIMAIKSSLTTAEIVKGINFAENNGASVINASWGGAYNDITLKNAINGFGGLFIAAAGNGTLDNSEWNGVGKDNDSVSHIYPCDYDSANVVCVAATDQNDNLASFSNYGATSVDVGAPGVDIYSTIVDILSNQIFSEDFASATLGTTGTNFISGGTNDDWGVWDSVGNKVISPTSTIYLPYAGGSDSTLTLNSAIDTSSASRVNVEFLMSCDTEVSVDWTDYVQVELLDNSNQWIGDSSWRFDVVTSPIEFWNPHTLAVSDESFLHSSFKLRFRWITNDVDNDHFGCDIDDITVTNFSLGTNDYEHGEGTSMAVPHVAGLAGLVWSYQPELTFSQVKDVILSTGDSLFSLNGKTVSGKRINAYNALLNSQVPVVTGLSDDAIPTKSKTWNWDSDDATAEFRYLIDQVENSVPSDPYSDIKTATQSDGDGVYYLHVQARSAAGIESPVTTVSAVLDNSAPVMEILAPLTGSIVNGSSTVEFSSNETVNAECSFDGLLIWTSCENGLTILADITGFSMLPEGAFSLYIKGTDVVGITGSDIETGIIKDTTSPTGLITNPTGGSVFATIPAFTATADDINGTASVKFQYKASTSDSFVDINTDTSAPFEANWSGISLVSNTTYDLKIIIEDMAGNLASVSGVSFIYDITAPDQPIITSPASSITVNGDNYSIEGTAETDSFVQVYSGPSVVGSWQLVGGETSFSIAVPLTQDTDNSFEVSSTDIVGNESLKTTVVVITEDSVFPAIEIYTLDNPVISPQVSPGINDTASFDLKFSETVDYSIKIKSADGVVVRSWISTALNPQLKVWDGKDGANYVSDGVYTIEIILTDEAGNSITDTSKTITVNNDPLTLNPIGDKNIDELVELTFAVVATNSEDVSIVYSLTDAPLGASIDPFSGVFSWIPTEAQGPGNYTLNINAVSGDLFKTEGITITVNEVNTNPVANAQSVSTDEDTDLIITLTSLDTDIPENTLIYSIVSDVSNGTLDTIAGNQVTYTPNENYTGSDSFIFRVSDTSSSSSDSSNPEQNIISDFLKTFGLNFFMSTPVSTDTANDGTTDDNIATVSITVTPVNDAPIAGDDTASVDEDMALIISKSELLANDSDVDGDPLNIISVDSPVNGFVSIIGDDINYVPDVNFNGTASFEYIVSDGTLTDIGAVTITVNPINDIPVADSQTVTVEEDSSRTITLSGSDIDGDSLIFSIASGPLHGTLGEIFGNQVTYSPDADYTGSDSFEFEVNDGHVDSFPTLVTITVTPFDDPPVLNPIGNFLINELEELTFTANASDPEGATLTYSVDGNPEGATINSSTGKFSWIPSENQGPGDYTFSVFVSDGAKTDSEEVTVTVNEVNVAPEAVGQNVSADEDVAKTIYLEASDSDWPENNLSYFIVDSPTDGALGEISNGQVIYTPNANYSGEDSFSFSADDGLANSVPAVITITVNPVNDAPIAINDEFSTDEDVVLNLSSLDLTSNDTDVDGDVLYVVDVNDPFGGVVQMYDSTIVFNPDADFNGMASFEYTVSDGALTDVGIVNIAVNPVNDSPVANDQGLIVEEDVDIMVSLVAIDVDGDILTYSIVSDPSSGVLSAISGNQLTYTPTQDFNGFDYFTFKVSDGLVESNTAIIGITVTPVNDSPEAVNDLATTPEDFQLFIDVSTLLSNDTDVDNDPLSIVSVGDPINGTVELLESGIVFTPTDDFNGTASFEYTASDGNGGTNTATVEVNVTPVNDAPVANNDTVRTDINTEITIPVDTLLGNDTDVDGDYLSIVSVGSSVNGTVFLSESGVVFGPDTDFTGIAEFDYTLSDGNFTDTGKVFVEVEMPPVISGESSTTPSQTSAIITWFTDHLTDSRVIYDTVSHSSLDFENNNYGYAFSTATYNTDPMVLEHEVAIAGLSDGTVYFYRVVSRGSPVTIGEQYSFKTLTYAGPPATSGGGAVASVATQVLGVSTPDFRASGTEGYQEEDQELSDEEVIEDELSVEEKLGVDSAEGILGDAVEDNIWKRIRTGIFVFGVVYIVWCLFFRKKK